MKIRCFFIMALLCLLISSFGAVEAQVLTKRITLTVKDATLPQVLQLIQKQYAVRFSYLNNSLPARQRFSAEVKDKPLAEVLDVLLAQTDIGYLERNGQVILKQGLPKKQPNQKTFQKLPPATPDKKQGNRGETVIETKVTTTVKPDGSVANKVETQTKPAKPSPPENQNTPETKVPATDASSAATTPQPVKQAAEPVPVIDAGSKPEVTDTLANEEGFSVTVKKLLPRFKLQLPAFSEDSSMIQTFHVGFIYPLSTNGVNANRYVNRYSLHALAGTSAGLQGVEVAGFGSMARKYVKGAQFSGFVNIAGNPGGLNEGYSLQGGQFAGFLNISSADSWGVQSAGFLNITKNMGGAQIAGFLNVADTVKGAQIAGFLNKAKYVKGTQIGIINVADSVSGVPIGLISIVKNGGYRRLELFYADDFEGNATYKMGVHKYYTFLGLSAQLTDNKRWAYGAGFGAEWQPAKRFHINTDLAAYHVIEESYDNFPGGLIKMNELNLLNKFRLLATLQVTKRLAVFGGPVYNVFVSQYQEQGETKVGSLLKTNTFYDHTSSNGTNVKMWIGFNAGIRF